MTHIINPLKMTDAMLSSTLAEDSTSAWTNTTYTVGAERHVVAVHRVYRCAVDIAVATGISPESDPTNWVDMRPTNKWAPFDIYTSTAATGTTSFTYTLKPGYFNAFYLAKPVGSSYTATLKDAPGGSTIWSSTGYLYEDPLGWYEYLFNPVTNIGSLVFSDLPIRPNAELTLTIETTAGQPVGLGLIAIGDYQPLFGYGDWGGAQYGASAEPVTYSYIKTNDDGTTEIVRRHAATNLRINIAMPRSQADTVVQTLQSVLDVPVAVIASEKAGYRRLSTFGLIGSSPVSYDSFATANLSLTVKGVI